MEMIGIPEARGFLEMQSGKPVEQHFERDLQFQPRQRCADAEMDAGAEGKVFLV